MSVYIIVCLCMALFGCECHCISSFVNVCDCVSSYVILFRCMSVYVIVCHCLSVYHDDVIKWKHFPRNWPFVRKIHRSPVNFPHKGQWRGALMFSLIYVWINDWANNREAGDLRRQHGHYDVIVMMPMYITVHCCCYRWAQGLGTSTGGINRD